MPKFLLSPTETGRGGEKGLLQLLGDDAIVSTLPEQKGADILIYSKAGLYGAQRKEVPHDFIASISDGRLARETSLLPRNCKFYEIICEGRFRYWPDGHLAVDRKSPSSYTRKQIRGILFNIKYVKGVPVEYTDDLQDTANYLRWMYEFLNKEKHQGLLTRPSTRGAWYVPTAEEVQSWLLQSWNGIGPSTANAIIEHFGGAPLRWTCTTEELAQVRGISRAKAAEMVKTLNPASNPFDELRRKLRG